MDVELLSRGVDKLHETFDRSDLDIEWKKIEQKLREAHYSPGDPRPLADAIFSLLLAARSAGFKVKTVMAELEKVATASLEGRWKKMADGTYQHVD